MNFVILLTVLRLVGLDVTEEQNSYVAWMDRDDTLI